MKFLLDHGAKSPGDVVLAGTQMKKPDLVKVGLDKGGIDKETLSKALGAAMKSKNSEIIDMLKAAGAARRSRLKPSSSIRRSCKATSVPTPEAAAVRNLR